MGDPQPMTWNGLSNINQVTPFGTSNDECLNEIRLVLEKHGRTDRFGVALLHRHFEMVDDEILVENVDVAERTLVTKPVKSGEVMQERLKPTVWRFDGGRRFACAYCPTDAKGGHHGYKEPH
jgi:hypothetical protein